METESLALQDQKYRDRWLSCFLASYSTIGVIFGLNLTATTFLKVEKNDWLIYSSVAFSIIGLLMILFLLAKVRALYDFLGFHPNPKNEEGIKEYKAKCENTNDWLLTRRKRHENAIHVVLLLQILTLSALLILNQSR